MCRSTVVVKLKVISFKTLIFKAKISTTHVSLNIGSKAGSWRNATIFAFDCKNNCCETYVTHCKENAPIYMYYVAPETPMMSSVIADCPDLVPPQYFGQVYASALGLCLDGSDLAPDLHVIFIYNSYLIPWGYWTIVCIIFLAMFIIIWLNSLI